MRELKNNKKNPITAPIRTHNSSINVHGKLSFDKNKISKLA
jgi:hypothetical protein